MAPGADFKRESGTARLLGSGMEVQLDIIRRD